MQQRITFVAAVNDQEILRHNLLASICLQPPHCHQILVQEGFPSAAKAYNDAIARAENDLIVFIHQDVWLPGPWLQQLEGALKLLQRTDPNWGVLGCWGVSSSGMYSGHIYSSGLGVLGDRFTIPAPVQTLDEIVLIVKKHSGLQFDNALPHFHFYGTDICMRAASQGLNCYAISAFCVHNTAQILQLPPDFYRSYYHVKRVWRERLPIETSCIRISRFDTEVRRRKIEDFISRKLKRRKQGAVRVLDPVNIVENLNLVPEDGISVM
jgi:hypothetical protein